MSDVIRHGKIPLVIGTAGHSEIRDEDREALRKSVRQELKKLREQCPHTSVVMLSALEPGSDLLCADMAEETGISLWAVLPEDRALYEKRFSPEERALLLHHLARAEKVYTAAAAETPQDQADSRDRYRQTGIHIAEHCHILLALWNGTENTADCGAAATVGFALHGSWQPARGTASRSAENAAVIHVLTPRREDGTAENAGEIRVLGNLEAMEAILKKTEEFNTLAEGTEEGEPLLSGESGTDRGLREMEALYHTADRLSMRFAREYRRILGGLAVTGTLLTLAFLLYDESNMIPMILVCGAALITAYMLSGKAERSACHRRYIEFRALAETVRVQIFLRYAGSRIETQRLMTWTQQRETAWILCAVCAANAEASPEKKREIRGCWAEEQQRYHQKAGKRNGRKKERNDKLVRVILLCTVAVYTATLLMELLCGGLIFRPAAELKNIDLMRTVMKILLGTLSAGTLFLTSYYGKLNVERQTSDHEKMEAFFRIMSERLAEQGQTESLLETLAREELAENGSWCSYRRDQKPELDF